jgi:hypothetical protein
VEDDQVTNNVAGSSPFQPSALSREQSVPTRRSLLAGTAAITTALAASALVSDALAQAQKAAPTPAASPGRKPNILVIFGDDIGVPQISAYTMGLMGYRTPNIDRIASEGAIFTDAYGQQSCTAGRASFILGPVFRYVAAALTMQPC